jgi:hypothetical protein
MLQGSSNDDEDNIKTVVFYVILGIGTLFSCLNIVAILANSKTMLKNLYCQFMLVIQGSYLILCIIDAVP